MPRGAVKTQVFRLRFSGEMTNQDGGAVELLVAERDEWAILAKNISEGSRQFKDCTGCLP